MPSNEDDFPAAPIQRGTHPLTPDNRDCLDDDLLAALAEGSLDPESRARVLPHLARCGRCRSAVASLARALADRAVSREVRAAEAPPSPLGSRWWRPLAIPAAAAALFLLIAYPAGLFRNRPDPVHRAPVLANGTTPSALAPVGAVASARQLQWRSVAGADRYRVTLFDAGGRVLYEAEPLDTVAALPDSLHLTPGRRYLWRVEARVGFDRWVASDLIEFSLGGRP